MFREEDFYLSVYAKTTWGVKPLVQALEKQIASQIEDKDVAVLYTQALINFENYAKNNNITSIGRIQFYDYFHAELKRLALIINKELCTDINKLPDNELLKENRQLKRALAEAQKKLYMIESILKESSAFLGAPSR